MRQRAALQALTLSFVFASILFLSACKSSKERQDEVADDNVLKNYVNEPKEKALAVKNKIEQRQRELDFDRVESNEGEE